ncbi:MAG TPA: hypothetical protein VHB70_06985, partial [Parafilimonas sp.]|nr:hypothetical protein [Parafilimonas sp.]
MQGYYEKAFEYYAKDIIIQQKKIKYQNDRIFATSRLAELYLTSGDTITAIKYFNQSAIYSRPYDESKYYNLRGTVNFLQGNLDSALYYFKFVNASEDNPNLGEIYLLKKNYARALQYFLKPLVAAKKANKIYYNMVLLDNIAKCYANQNNLTLAQKYATEL